MSCLSRVIKIYFKLVVGWTFVFVTRLLHQTTPKILGITRTLRALAKTIFVSCELPIFLWSANHVIVFDNKIASQCIPPIEHLLGLFFTIEIEKFSSLFGSAFLKFGCCCLGFIKPEGGLLYQVLTFEIGVLQRVAHGL